MDKVSCYTDPSVIKNRCLAFPAFGEPRIVCNLFCFCFLFLSRETVSCYTNPSGIKNRCLAFPAFGEPLLECQMFSNEHFQQDCSHTMDHFNTRWIANYLFKTLILASDIICTIGLVCNLFCLCFLFFVKGEGHKPHNKKTKS